MTELAKQRQPAVGGDAPKHRHPVEGGYQRGEETRARIIEAALKLFGERGYEGASTREIATSAGVNAPALQYYFDNKEGLYIACAEHIVARVSEYMAEVLDQANRAVAENADDETLIEAYCVMQARLADFLFTTRDKDDWRLFLARQQGGEGPPAGCGIAHQRMNKPISRTSAAIIGRLLGKPADDEETVIRTAALSGQLSVFQMVRRSVLALLNWESIEGERLALLKRVLREQTVALLRSMVAMREERRGAADAR